MLQEAGGTMGIAAVSAGLIIGCVQAQEAAQPAAEAPAQPFPFVSVDLEQRVIEIEGIVPVDCHDEETPDIFLEVVACTPGTKEHEALVMTRAKPSHVHAALLSIGLEPGRPGRWTYQEGTVTRDEPEGPAVKVEIVYTNDAGEVIEADVRDWIVDIETLERFEASWVFAGSRVVRYRDRDFYDADGTGMLVGLTTFGSEVIACSEVISHEAEITEPQWIADRELVPAFKTPVTLRLSVEDIDVPADSP